MSLANSSQEKYYKHFDFFFNRSCFRTMTEFYKNKFNKFNGDRLAALKRVNPQLWQKTQKMGGLTATSLDEMIALMIQFIGSMFGANIMPDCMDEKLQRQIILSMMTVVFSHRYNKGDRFIIEAEQDQAEVIDFNIVRDVMYKYSMKA